MTVTIVSAALGLFGAGVAAAVIGVVSLAIHGEERNLTLTGEAPNALTRTGRFMNGVYVRAPRLTGAADREMTHA
jgi:hypothetical protein